MWQLFILIYSVYYWDLLISQSHLSTPHHLHPPQLLCMQHTAIKMMTEQAGEQMEKRLPGHAGEYVPILLILGVCAPLTVFCDTFSVITSAVSFQGWSGDLWLLCYIVFPCFLVCTVEIFMPRVSSLQSLTLGTRSVICSFSLYIVSDTGHKSALLWIIWTDYEPCAPGSLGLPLRLPSCPCTTFYSCYFNIPTLFLCSSPRTCSSALP